MLLNMAKSVLVYHLVWCTLEAAIVTASISGLYIDACRTGAESEMPCSGAEWNAGSCASCGSRACHPVAHANREAAERRIGYAHPQGTAPGARRWRNSYYANSLCDPVTVEVIAYVKNLKRRHAEGKLWPSLEDTSNEPDNPDNAEPD